MKKLMCIVPTIIMLAYGANSAANYGLPWQDEAVITKKLMDEFEKKVIKKSNQDFLTVIKNSVNYHDTLLISQPDDVDRWRAEYTLVRWQILVDEMQQSGERIVTHNLDNLDTNCHRFDGLIRKRECDIFKKIINQNSRAFEQDVDQQYGKNSKNYYVPKVKNELIKRDNAKHKDD
jgi:hypothetical protein